MAIQIPADVTIVTLRASGSELPQRFTESHAESLLAAASDLLRAHADIEFPLGVCERVVEEMPPGAELTPEQVRRAPSSALARRFGGP